MATKYDWSEQPETVQWIATDEDGFAMPYQEMPYIHELFPKEWFGEVSLDGVCFFPQENPYKGDWRDSLEQRPTN